MGYIRLRTDNSLERDGAPPFRLQDEISPAFVESLLCAELGDPMFIGELCRDVLPSEKKRLRHAVKALGGQRWRRYALQATRWAPIINQDNRWHLEDFDPVYEAEISSWWADRVVVTTANIRLVVTPRGLHSFPEFEYTYGQNIVEHLRQVRDRKVSDLTEVIQNISAELERRTVTIVNNADTVGQLELTVLSSLPPDRWRLPEGCRLLSVDS